ncbi:MAG: TonB-dependent receptor [Gammaproteobacteria bacterium]|nr:TonB-dependent receptor [Gammaproteobacteria bacterium]
MTPAAVNIQLPSWGNAPTWVALPQFGNYSGAAAPLGLGPIRDGSESYWVVNARATWETDDWRIAVWGKNLTDEVYYPNGINVEGSYNSTYLVRAAPLTFGAELRYNF